MQKTAEKPEKYAAYEGTVKSESRAFRYRFIIFSSQRPAHHAGCSHTEQIIHGIKRQQHRRSQGYRRIFHRIIHHPHKIGISHIVKHHDKGAEDHRNSKLCHCPGYRRFFKELYLFVFFHLNTIAFSTISFSV